MPHDPTQGEANFGTASATSSIKVEAMDAVITELAARLHRLGEISWRCSRLHDTASLVTGGFTLAGLSRTGQLLRPGARSGELCCADGGRRSDNH